MADAVRIGLFGLSLGAVAASGLLVVGAVRLGGAGTVLALWVVGCGQVVLLAEGLSLLGALDWPGFLGGHLAILGAMALWARGRPGGARWCALGRMRAGLVGLWPVVWAWRTPALPLLAGCALVVGLIGVVQAVWVPPNSVDSLSYHLTRVGYYLQFRSFDHYPTDDWRQVAHLLNAELLILWSVAFLRADWLANGVQFLAWVVTTVAVYGLGRQVGFGPRAALFAAGLFALLPQSVLQSTSTLNDLVVASFVAASLYFLLQGPGAGPLTPDPCLVLAGAAGGLALGTKPTAALALPGLAVVLLVLFGWRASRRVLVSTMLGGVAAVLLGSYTYIQNWLVFGSPFGPPTWSRTPSMLEGGPVSSFAWTLFRFAFADLSGPLAAPAAQPVAEWLAYTLGAIAEQLFAALGIPTVVRGGLALSLVLTPRTQELYSGVGLVGGLIVVAALAAIVWPTRIPLARRLIGFIALSYLVCMALALRWDPFGPGRYILTACAIAAPLLGALFGGRGTWWRQGLAIALALWSGTTGLYIARSNEDKPIASLSGQDRLGSMMLNFPTLQAFFREADAELGPESIVGVYGIVTAAGGWKGQWEYPFFGSRFTRTLLPLVGSGYVERQGIRRPLPWSNEALIAAYRPMYVVLESRRPGADVLPDIRDRCFELPLEHGKPTVPWELWRCRDDDPRSVLENGDFQAGPAPEGARAPVGWAIEVAGEGRLVVGPVAPEGDGEPFRVRLDYRAGDDPGAEGGIVQDVAVGSVRGRTLVVDARVLADQVGAAVLWVDDGRTVTEVANATTEPETLRLAHPVDARATELAVHLDASGAGGDASVLVRTLLAIPRGP